MPFDDANWSAVTPSEIRRRLAAADFDLERLDRLSADLKIDLVSLLAGWTPVIVEVFAPSPKLTWWQRFLQWRRGR